MPKRLLLVSSLLAATGCFVYSPTETRNTPAGKPIEVMVTPTGAQALAPTVGPHAQVVAGVLYRDDASVIEMRFARVRRTDGKDLAGTGEMLRIPHDHVVSVYTRSVSKPRTWAATLTGLTAFVFANRRH